MCFFLFFFKRKQKLLLITNVSIFFSGAKGDEIHNVEGPHSSITTKKSIVEIVNHDEICMARAITMAFLKVNKVNTDDWHALKDDDDERNMEKLVWIYKKAPEWYYSKLLLHKPPTDRLTKLAHELCKLADIPINRTLALSDISAFERFLNVDILVINATGGNKFIKTPPEHSKKQRLYLYLVLMKGPKITISRYR